MEFSNTGLPNRPDIYKAYMLYKNMRESLPEQVRDHGLNVARVLTEAGCKNERTIIFALLRIMPEKMQDLLRERYGAAFSDLAREISYEAQNGFRNIGRASDAVKQICTAEHIVVMNKIIADKIPSQYDFVGFFTKINGCTGSPALETRYAQTLGALYQQMSVPPQQMMGFDDEDILIEEMPVGSVDPMSFDTQGLPDDPKLRAAYNILMNETRTIEEDKIMAMQTVGLMMLLPEMFHPEIMAAAMLDIGIRRRDAEDLDDWEDQIGEDAVEILKSGSVYSKDYKRDLQEQIIARIALTYSFLQINVSLEQIAIIVTESGGRATQEINVVRREMNAWVEKALPIMSLAKLPDLEAELIDRVNHATEQLSQLGIKPTPKPPSPK